VYDSEKALMNELELEGLSVKTPLKFLCFHPTTSRYHTTQYHTRRKRAVGPATTTSKCFSVILTR